VRWGTPEQGEIDEYETLAIDGVSVYVHHAVRDTASARIDLVTGGVGTKLIFLGLAAHR